jgi:hypothetical protein
MKSNNTIIQKLLIILLLTNNSFNWSYTPPASPINITTKLHSNWRGKLAILNTNKIIITWTSIGASQQSDVYIMIVNSDAQVILNDTRLNTISGTNSWSTIAVDEAGGFVIIWHYSPDSSKCLTNTIYAKYYNSSYNAGVEVQLPSLTPSYCNSETVPSVIYTPTGFIACNNALLQKFTTDSSNNIILGITRSIEINSAGYSMECVLASLKNGNFVSAYIYFNNLVYGILSEGDFSYIKPLTTMGNNDRIHPEISLLSTCQFLFTWIQNNSYIAGQTFDLAGVSISQEVNMTSLSTCGGSVNSLGANGYIAAYTTSSVNYILFENDMTKNTEGTLLGPILPSYKDVYVAGNESIFATVHDGTTSIYVNIFKNDNPAPSPNCNNFTIYIGSGDSPILQIKFYSNSGVYFTSKPLIGSLVDVKSAPLNLYTKYLESNIYYKFSNPTADSFSYTNNIQNGICEITITQCYISCGACTSLGSLTNNLCTYCDTFNNFYPLSDNSSNCFEAANPPDRYYLDSDVWKKCLTVCQTCTGYPSDPTTDMKCIKCISGYSLKGTNCTIPKKTQVLKSTKPPALLTSTKPSCYKFCKECSGYPADPNVDMLCKANSCIAGYYVKVDNLTSCFTGEVQHYYFDVDIYRKCHPNCLTCNNIPGTETNNQCKSCIANYFPKADEPYNCFTGDQPFYYFDNIYYRKCYPTCLTCKTLGTELNHRCDTCLMGYLPRADNLTSCFTGDIDFYYLDSSMYQQCYSTCLTCINQQSSTDNHQCTKCIKDYYPKVDNMLSCFTGNQDGYYLDENIYRPITGEDANILSSPSQPDQLGTTCNPTPCVNGDCDVVLNKARCTCDDDYIGSLCQYNNDTFNIQALLDSYYNTHSPQTINDLIAVITAQPHLIDPSKLELLYQSICKIIFILVLSLDETINACDISEKTYSLINLAILTQSLCIKPHNESEKLKNITNIINNIDILSRNFTNFESSLIIGDAMFSSQIYISGNETEVKKVAMTNNFPIYDLKECQKVLKQYYNISESAPLIFVSNNYNLTPTNNKSLSNIHTISVYNYATREKLNLDLCSQKNITQTIQMPLTDVDGYNLTLYKEMNDQGIDIFDPNNTFFNDRCAGYIDNYSLKDTTVNSRRKEYFQKIIPECIGFNCTYTGINEHNYIECLCGIKTDNEYINEPLNYAIGTLTRFNFDVVLCASSIPVNLHLTYREVFIQIQHYMLMLYS